MRRRLLIAAFSVLGLGLGALAAYAYDAGREDRIAAGVEVGGLDLGGMRAAEAEDALRRRLEPALRKPVVVHYRGRRYRLPAARAAVTVQTSRMVEEAVRESRAGSAFSRVARDLTGGSVDARITVRVRYSREAVAAFARAVKRSLDRPARNASVEPAGAGLRKISGREGVSVRRQRLGRAIAAALARPAKRLVAAPVEVRRPRVTNAELADRYRTFLTVDRKSFRLRLFKRLKLARTYRIGVGRVGFETPVGLYRIQNKAVNPSWFVPDKPWAGKLAGKVIPPGPDNPIKSRWLGIYDGAGIHGTAEEESIGTRASHGCIRMLISEVERLYERVPVGTPVYID